jgi:hypothetical protein
MRKPSDGRIDPSVARLTHPWWWRQYAPLKRRSTIILHGSITQKTALNNKTLSSYCANSLCWTSAPLTPSAHKNQIDAGCSSAVHILNEASLFTPLEVKDTWTVKAKYGTIIKLRSVLPVPYIQQMRGKKLTFILANLFLYNLCTSLFFYSASFSTYLACLSFCAGSHTGIQFSSITKSLHNNANFTWKLVSKCQAKRTSIKLCLLRLYDAYGSMQSEPRH